MEIKLIKEDIEELRQVFARPGGKVQIENSLYHPTIRAIAPYELTRAKPGDAGIDLRYWGRDAELVKPGEVRVIPTSVQIEIPYGYYGEVKPRSGLMAKGYIALNGTIDSGYRGEIKVTIFNATADKFMHIHKGDRIAQLVIKPCWMGEIELVSLLSETERGEDGFGSTGME